MNIKDCLVDFSSLPFLNIKNIEERTIFTNKGTIISKTTANTIKKIIAFDFNKLGTSSFIISVMFFVLFIKSYRTVPKLILNQLIGLLYVALVQ